jgi:tetratricopeptide (TPR) repeat protein
MRTLTTSAGSAISEQGVREMRDFVHKPASGPREFDLAVSHPRANPPNPWPVFEGKGSDEPLATAKMSRPFGPGLLGQVQDEARPVAPIPEGSIWDGRYRIERSLGEGGMGNVLLASDLANDERPIALKVLQPAFREVATPYFMREYSIQRQIRHPSIARAIAFGFDIQGGDEVPYFAMPFVAGVPLASLLTPHPPTQHALRWTREVLEALDAIHRAGFLHRDIKPGNVLVDPHADSGAAARLIDFGIATPLDAPPEDFFIGTPEFSAPERIDCSRPFDVRSDLYAVGLLLYEMLEGVPPWLGTEPEVLLAARRDTPPRPMEGAWPAPLEALVHALLHPEPEGRPLTAAAVIEQLDGILPLLNPDFAQPHRPLESVEAFEQRLRGGQAPAASYRRALDAEAPVLVIHVPDGHNGQELLDEIGDRRAMSGVRVVRLRLRGRPGPPMHELQLALDIFRRLRDRHEPPGTRARSTSFRGLAGAAVLLTRLRKPTLLVLEGIDQADEATLMVLSQCFLGAQSAMLSVVATLDLTTAPRSGAALDAFLEQTFVREVVLDAMSPSETSKYLQRLLGPRPLDASIVGPIRDAARGRPLEVQRLLVEAYRRADLLRTSIGYEWSGPTPHGASGASANVQMADFERELADRASLLQIPFPAEAVETFVRGPENLRRLLEAQILAEMGDGWVVMSRRDECAARYAMLDQGRRRTFHRELAEALSKLQGLQSMPVLVADQLTQSDRPASAVPWLVMLARQARLQAEDQRSASLLARARQLLERDDRDDASLWDWRLMVFTADLDAARASGDFERLSTIAQDLLKVAVECAHLPSIDKALSAELDRAEMTWDLPTIEGAVDRLMLFRKSCGGTPLPSLSSWHHAVKAALEGDVPSVLKHVATGLKAVDPAAGLGRWVRRKLLMLQAEVCVRVGLRTVAPRALDTLERALVQEREVDPAHVDEATYRLAQLRGMWLRRTGEAAAARQLLESQEVLPTLQRRAALALELAECHLAAGQFDEADTWAKRASERARREKAAALALGAESVLAELRARRGEIDGAVERLGALLATRPAGVLPQILVDARQRWITARLAQMSRSISDEGRELFADAEAHARHAATMHDAGSAARAIFLAVQVALRTRRPAEALAFSEWLEQIHAQDPVGGPPKHAVEWLVASVHYQMKWFKSANALSRKAMETLRVSTQSASDGERDIWMASDPSLIGFFR